MHMKILLRRMTQPKNMMRPPLDMTECHCNARDISK
jgi:hypothetical protein